MPAPQATAVYSRFDDSVVILTDTQTYRIPASAAEDLPAQIANALRTRAIGTEMASKAKV
ncbi:hypothetical protein [Sphingomonas alpina]|uniref:Uncharacterized protein n=1 Tax=Sphingomonas alpina TaxID=653931 RepID=A0A7H0LHY1_9SPHN|nr:hypothetical protein [Sphingomonas alpina]QNQ09284.1 hypothetical protein H3Z74_21860 [Sphingomonas alpina]